MWQCFLLKRSPLNFPCLKLFAPVIFHVTFPLTAPHTIYSHYLHPTPSPNTFPLYFSLRLTLSPPLNSLHTFSHLPPPVFLLSIDCSTVGDGFPSRPDSPCPCSERGEGGRNPPNTLKRALNPWPWQPGELLSGPWTHTNTQNYGY